MNVRSVAAAVSTAALATTGLGVSTAQAETPSERLSCQGSPSNAFPDFDASGGPPDIVTGAPGEDVDAGPNAGVVEVRYGAAAAHPEKQALILDAPAPEDQFGAALTAAHVNDDGCDDLLVGVPGRDTDGVDDAGAVAVFLGSDDGLRFDSLLVQGTDGIPGEPQRLARFGDSLDAFTDNIVVGVPGKDVGAAIGAGAVVELHTDERGFFGTEISQDLPGVPDQAETADRWGSSVSVHLDDFTAGAPGETVDGAKGAGAVIDRTDGEYELLTQNSPDMPGLAEADDQFGAAVARPDSDRGAVFIGVPGESTGGEYKAGMLNSWEPGVGSGPGVTQDSPGFSGDSEDKDGFGSALAAYSGSGNEDGPYTVQVGVPGEDIRTAREAGMVVALAYHSTDGQRPAEFEGMYGLSADNTAGAVHSGDGFGSTFGLATEALDDPDAGQQLYIGVPGYGDGGAVVRYTADGGAELRTQIIGASEEGDAYGGSLLQ